MSEADASHAHAIQPTRFDRSGSAARSIEIDALRCPRCGSTLRLIAAIEDPAIARRILACIGLPARAPAISPASSRDASFAYAWPGGRALGCRAGAAKPGTVTPRE